MSGLEYFSVTKQHFRRCQLRHQEAKGTIAIESTVHSEDCETLQWINGVWMFYNRWLWRSNNPERENGQRYIGILEEKLNQFMDLLGCTVFQQDNAPCHTAKIAKQWFQQHNINILEWPSSSPDLNPIENLWQQVKQKLSKQKITSVGELKKKVCELSLIHI